ncbi:alpha-hydroxy-acid oxidizing protein [Paraburkholderia caribensis]|uniref:alpha-hydroxy-acid oxidizing protein n=1 Tax=Paraburkholderia caribensis TaxID=75105 RepID=UPI003908B69D
MLDGGFRRGSDILKAMALGADAVLLGRRRPTAWARPASRAPRARSRYCKRKWIAGWVCSVQRYCRAGSQLSSLAVAERSAIAGARWQRARSCDVTRVTARTRPGHGEDAARRRRKTISVLAGTPAATPFVTGN